jgi:hypothetical protein
MSAYRWPPAWKARPERRRHGRPCGGKPQALDRKLADRRNEIARLAPFTASGGALGLARGGTACSGPATSEGDIAAGLALGVGLVITVTAASDGVSATQGRPVARPAWPRGTEAG